MDCNQFNHDKKKLSKAEKKALRKQQRAKSILDRHILKDEFKVTNGATRHLLIGNGGLGCGITRIILTSVFNRYGQITNIIMLPNKPFSVLSYQSVADAIQAYNNVHGAELLNICQVDTDYLLKSGIKAFFLNYLEDYFFETKTESDASLPEGLLLIKDYITQEEEEELMLCIGWSSNNTQSDYGDDQFNSSKTPSSNDDTATTIDQNSAQQQLKHRRVKHFGYEFRYGSNTVDKDKPLDAAIPKNCRNIIQRMKYDGYIKDEPDQLTVNEYMPGQGRTTDLFFELDAGNNV